jgi:hypothetical protein
MSAIAAGSNGRLEREPDSPLAPSPEGNLQKSESCAVRLSVPALCDEF